LGLGRIFVTMEVGKPFKVSEFTFLIQRKLQEEAAFQNAKLIGEVSNLRPPNASGHVYFTLKDSQAQISCAMFRQVALKHTGKLPGNGEEVVVTGDLSLYPPQGSYQLIVRSLERVGMEGLLHKRFLDLKAKLQAEGLFDTSRKRKIPSMPRCIAVVTSPTGAVIRDIIQTVRRRFPHITLLVLPTVVQGAQGAESIVSNLVAIQSRQDVDVVILARGGGSLEDLWCFNEEVVARAIAGSRIPVVSAVGHETDFTIADFVADLRAATPTAAAELCVPDVSVIQRELDDAKLKLKRTLQFFVLNKRQQLDDYEYKLQVRFENLMDVKRQVLKESFNQMEHAFWTQLQRARHDISMLEAQMNSLDLRQVLDRGFTLTELDGKRITRLSDLEPGQQITSHFSKGRIHSTVDDIQTHE